jgi:uncharacterized protein YhaN
VQPEIAAEPTDDVSRPKALQTLTGLVGQLEADLEEVSGLGDVIRAIEDATADLSADHREFGIEARVRRLRDDLEREATGWPSLAVRLGLVADTIRSSS